MLAATVLAACASEPYDPGAAKARASWRGATYDEVAKAWGPPRTAVNDGTNYTYTWISEEPPRSSGASVGFGVGRAGPHSGVGVGFGFPIGGAQPPVAGDRCTRTVVFRDGRVVDESWNGPDEYCQNFRKP